MKYRCSVCKKEFYDILEGKEHINRNHTPKVDEFIRPFQYVEEDKK